ncbi:MAG: fimbria/pilus outer membrane usher protein, partial [Caulobacter sp.]
DEQSARFRDLGDLEVAPRAGRKTDRFVGSLSLQRHGSVALAYIDSRVLSGPRDRIVSASYQRAIGERATLLVTADHDLKTRTTGGQVRLTVPFGRNTVGAAVSHVDGRTLTALDYGRSMPTEGGLGIDAGLATDQRGKAYGQGSLTYRTRNVELQAGGAFADRTGSGWAGATGAVVFMDGGVFTANQASDAFAVVATGLPGVGVYYENQLVGATGRGGRLFVPNVVAYQSSTFAIDTLMLSEGYVAASVSQDVAVREGAGAVIRMPVRQARSMLVIVADANGAPLEPGGRVERSDGGLAEVGWDGLVYLEDIPSRLDLTIDRRNGTRCTASVVIPDGLASLSKIGPVPCA